MKLGASIWPFHWDPPYEEGIRRIASLGFEAVELIAWNREFLDTYYTPARIRELRTVAQNEGLEISEFVSTPHALASPDRAEREKAIEHFTRAAEVAIELGTKIMNTVSVYPFDLQFPWITDLPTCRNSRSISLLDSIGSATGKSMSTRRCAVFCEQAGLKYALEPHPYRYMSNTVQSERRAYKPTERGDSPSTHHWLNEEAISIRRCRAASCSQNTCRCLIRDSVSPLV